MYTYSSSTRKEVRVVMQCTYDDDGALSLRHSLVSKQKVDIDRGAAPSGNSRVPTVTLNWHQHSWAQYGAVCKNHHNNWQQVGYFLAFSSVIPHFIARRLDVGKMNKIYRCKLSDLAGLLPQSGTSTPCKYPTDGTHAVMV